MIRGVFIGSMVLLLLMVLYIPSSSAPERFFELMRHEHELNVQLWGEKSALDIVARMLDVNAGAQGAKPKVSGAEDMLTSSVGTEMTRVTHSFFANAYFRSIDSLIALAAFRISGLIQFLPLALLFGAAALVDGFAVRVVRSKVFVQHNPEAFAVMACTVIVGTCAMVLGAVLPVVIHPLWYGSGLLVLLYAMSRTVANYHKRG